MSLALLTDLYQLTMAYGYWKVGLADHRAVFHLFYRKNPFGGGYAICAGPLGPCPDAPENPILHSFNERQAGCLSGPGHPAVFHVGTRAFIAFHAWAASSSCRKADDERYLYVAPLFWQDGKPQIGMSLRPVAPGNSR